MRLTRVVFLGARKARISLALVLTSLLAATLSAQTASPVIQTVAGTGTGLGDGGTATTAVLIQPGGLAEDNNGNVYVAETGAHRIRKISPSGTITTVAGTGVAGFSGDGGSGLTAQLNSPYGLACDMAGNLYIADLGNARVRRLAVNGSITTVAGGGALTPGGTNEGSAATKMALGAPRDLAIDDTGVVYISDFTGNRVFKMAVDGTLTTFAGTGTAGNSGDGKAANSAQLASPAGLALDSQYSLYIADSQNHAIRKVANGILTTLLKGTTPTGVAVDILGGLWVADPGAGNLTDYPPGATTQVFSFSSSAVIRGGNFNIYATSDSAGTVMTITVNNATNVSSIAAGGGNAAQVDSLNQPTSVAVDSVGDIYIADTGNNRVRMISSSGVFTTEAASSGLAQPSGVSTDTSGNLYIADTGNKRVLSVSASGTAQTLGTNPSFTSPVGAVADGAGNVYVADFGAGTIQKIGSTGAISTLLSGLSGPRGLALLSGNLYFTEEAGPRVSRVNLSTSVLTKIAAGSWTTPRGIAVSPSGLVFVADSGRQQVVQVDTANNLSIVAGTGTAGFSGDGGAATSAQLNFPYGVALDSQGDLLIADYGNNRVRMIKNLVSMTTIGTITSTGSAPTGTMNVLNGASLTSGPVAPGMLLSLTGTGILGADMASTSVLINSILVPIVSMTDTAITVQAPLTLESVSQVEIAIVFKGTLAATVTVSGAAAAPALFVPVNTAANPVARGSVITLFGTGLGLGDLPVTVTIGGVPASVVSLNASPGYPGLFQVNATVPSALPVGAQSVTVAVGGVPSQAGIQVGVD